MLLCALKCKIRNRSSSNGCFVSRCVGVRVSTPEKSSKWKYETCNDKIVHLSNVRPLYSKSNGSQCHLWKQNFCAYLCLATVTLWIILGTDYLKNRQQPARKTWMNANDSVSRPCIVNSFWISTNKYINLWWLKMWIGNHLIISKHYIYVLETKNSIIHPCLDVINPLPLMAPCKSQDWTNPWENDPQEPPDSAWNFQ